MAVPRLNLALVHAPARVSEQKIENEIGALNKDEIKKIARSFVGAIMSLMSIDVQVTNIPRFVATSNLNMWTTVTYATKYDPNSKLMEILFPVCKKRIQQSFVMSREFMDNGIAFEFLNSEKNGLLDRVHDDNLQKKISEWMCGATFYATLTVEAGKLKIDQYWDGQRIASQADSIKNFLECADDCII